VQGTVVVMASLDSNGEVTDAQVISGPPELRKAALESVLQWHYDKALAPPANVRIAIDFALPPAGAPAAVKRVGPEPQLQGAVERIDLSTVPAPLRDKVAAALPLHVGEQIDSETAAKLKSSLANIDEHLETVIGRSRDGGVIVRVGLKGAASPAGGAPQRIRVGGNAQQMNLIEKVTPAYPPEAKEQRIQGNVQFTATIGKDGRVMSLELISGDPILAEAARQAVQQWVYRPTLLNGEPVEVLTQIDVNFTLSK
jgi:TonB family protein